MRQLLNILLISFTIFQAHSQTIAVKSFRKLEADQEARISSPKTDQNGKKCAMIKVVTSQVGFVFDFGLIGNAVATEQKIAEIWVWVPAGARKVTISHQQLGILRNYPFIIDIEEATVYEMVLTTGKVVTTIETQIESQWLVINSTPTGADVYIDDLPANQTPYQNELPLGKHTYRISYDMYLPSAGTVVLTADKKETINQTLKPNFGTLNVTSFPENGASVSIDDVNTGKTTPCTFEQVKTGEHLITLRLNMYKTSSEKFNIQAGDNLNIPVKLSPTFAEVTVNSNPASDIYIAGEQKGNGTWSGRLLPGIYLFEARKDKYAPVSEKHEVILGQALNLTLQPIAQTGTLKVMTTPTDAIISLDGVNQGTAPATLRNLLAGDYTLTLSISNYKTISKKITIAEGQTTQVTEAFVKGSSETINSVPISKVFFEMVEVKGGSFQMGNNNGENDERPVHRVTISDFSISKTEVTQAQFKAIMGNNPSKFIGDNLPVENVSWNTVQEFIQKLNLKTGITYRLPTEAEWEFAARGGNKTMNYKYSGSNVLGDVAWYGGNSEKSTHSVGMKQPNELGLFDMSGNVTEWCGDWYGTYHKNDQSNPTGSSLSSFRILRGGSWGSLQSNCSVSYREYAAIGDRGRVGFRLVLAH